MRWNRRKLLNGRIDEPPAAFPFATARRLYSQGVALRMRAATGRHGFQFCSSFEQNLRGATHLQRLIPDRRLVVLHRNCPTCGLPVPNLYLLLDICRRSFWPACGNYWRRWARSTTFGSAKKYRGLQGLPRKCQATPGGPVRPPDLVNQSDEGADARRYVRHGSF